MNDSCWIFYYDFLVVTYPFYLWTSQDSLSCREKIFGVIFFRPVPKI
jgi:hypothetical protein